MLKKSWLFISVMSMAINTTVAAKWQGDASHSLQSNQPLVSYLKEPENIAELWRLESRQYDSVRKVSIETYTLFSQTWPKINMSTRPIVWQHTLVLYLPDEIDTQQALLFVNGGTRYVNPYGRNPPPHQLNFARIAAETNSVVVDLQDVPNQHMVFDDKLIRKEDKIVAYTWNRYMQDPDRYLYWPAHLPMTKAIIKAMDATQQILLQEDHFQLTHFVVAGASKRGWATWLAALSDHRISAIVPIVIDVLNTQENLAHIYASYDHHWPAAFRDYVEEKIPERINTPEFAKLMAIEDPLAYLTGNEGAFYKKRLSIPKYIISASGDDFFVPDSLNLYLNKLPGETNIRVVPNQSHYINMHVIEEAILAFYRTTLQNEPRPVLYWKVNSKGILQSISTNQRPLSVKLWEAVNPNARDFRLASHINYIDQVLVGHCVGNHCAYAISLTLPAKGWKASFVEVSFPQRKGEPLTFTTPVYVLGARK